MRSTTSQWASWPEAYGVIFLSSSYFIRHLFFCRKQMCLNDKTKIISLNNDTLFIPIPRRSKLPEFKGWLVWTRLCKRIESELDPPTISSHGKSVACWKNDISGQSLLKNNFAKNKNIFTGVVRSTIWINNSSSLIFTIKVTFCYLTSLSIWRSTSLSLKNVCHLLSGLMLSVWSSIVTSILGQSDRSSLGARTISSAISQSLSIWRSRISILWIEESYTYD